MNYIEKQKTHQLSYGIEKLWKTSAYAHDNNFWKSHLNVFLSQESIGNWRRMHTILNNIGLRPMT